MVPMMLSHKSASLANCDRTQFHLRLPGDTGDTFKVFRITTTISARFHVAATPYIGAAQTYALGYLSQQLLSNGQCRVSFSEVRRVSISGCAPPDPGALIAASLEPRAPPDDQPLAPHQQPAPQPPARPW
jgi:hypothetical protein